MLGEVCVLTRSSEDGDLQDDIQAASWNLDWIIEPMLRKNLWRRMEVRKNLGSSVLQVLNLKPGIHMPFVHIVALLKWQINYTPTEDLTAGSVLLFWGRVTLSSSFYQSKNCSLQIVLSKDTNNRVSWTVCHIVDSQYNNRMPECIPILSALLLRKKPMG